MSYIKKETINMFNETVETLRNGTKDNMETRVGLVKFSTEVEVSSIWDKDVMDLPKLDDNTYIPNGWTAMNDGIGRAVEKLNEYSDINDPNVAVLLTIITDGEENFSKKYNGSLIKELLKSKQDTGRWTVTFLGANVDINRISNDYNIPINNTIAYVASAAGVNTLGASTLRGVSTYMSARENNITSTADFFNEENSGDSNKK